jgi:hypothetical protein
MNVVEISTHHALPFERNWSYLPESMYVLSEERVEKNYSHK